MLIESIKLAFYVEYTEFAAILQVYFAGFYKLSFLYRGPILYFLKT